jgi:pimeloyl-ACP methyl ester carboxylesterase
MGVAEIMAQDAPARRDPEHERIDGRRPGQGLGVVEAVPAQAANERIEELGVEEARQHLSRLGPFAGGALKDEQRIFAVDPGPAAHDALGQPRAERFARAGEDRVELQLRAGRGQEEPRTEGGYIAEQSTRPNTLAVGLGDSPAGLAAWITEKLIGWSDTTGGIDRAFSRDEILTWVTAYWLTNTIGTSFSPYVEPAKPADRVETPTVVSSFANDILLAPRRYAELFVNVQDFVEHPAGGHFAAWEQPAAYAADLDRAVRLGQRNQAPGARRALLSDEINCPDAG